MALTAPKSSGSAGRISTVVPSARSAYTRPVSCVLLTGRLPVSARIGAEELVILLDRRDVCGRGFLDVLPAWVVVTGGAEPAAQLALFRRAAGQRRHQAKHACQHHDDARDVHVQVMRETLRAVTVTTGYPHSQLSADDRAARYTFQARHGVRFTTANGPRLW